MKLYLIILIVIFLLVALSCKDKPQVTENFSGTPLEQEIKMITNIFTSVDINKNKVTDLNEIKKAVREIMLKQSNKKLSSLTPEQKKKFEQEVDNQASGAFSILKSDPKLKNKRRIYLRDLIRLIKKRHNSKNKKTKKISPRKSKRRSAERRRRRSAERRRRRSAERKRRSAERRRRQRGKSSKNKGKDCINDNKSFGISCKSQPGKNSFKCVIDKTTGNLAKASEIGKNLTTSNEVPKKVTKADSQKQIAELKKKIENQNKKINNLDSKVTNSTDKYFASVKNRDSKLLEANDGVKPIDPSNFSFKPNIEFKHKEPSRKIASAYGWSFMPPHYWSVPQKRPPACIPSKKNTATVTPIYDKSVPVDVMDYTQVGSILPKFEYNEVHNPNYYYPGWIAKKDEPYPGKNGKPVMKTGEYYSMKLARPTGLKPRDALNFGNKIIDEKIHPQKVIRKGIVRRSYRKAKK